MGSEDNAIQTNNLYLLTKDGYNVPMTATTLCIPDLISADMNEEDTETNGIAFIFRDSYTASFTVELTDESVKKLGRFIRATRRWSRKKVQQKKRKIAKEKGKNASTLRYVRRDNST